MSLRNHLEDILFEGLEQFDIKLTQEQLESLAGDVDLAVDQYNELASYQHDYDFTEQYTKEIKGLKNQVSEMYSKESYNQLQDRLAEKDRTIQRLRDMIDDLHRQMNQR